MKPIPGAKPPDPKDLVRARDRLTFLYVERCTINRDSNAITVADGHGIAHVPAAALSVLMLGPGVRITHSAISVLSESGSTVVWVGENGVRYYAHGTPPSRSSRLLEAQARAVSDPALRLAVARNMYLMRFVGEDVSKLSLQQLRGREGARVRRLYQQNSHRTGVPWDKREYDPDNFEDAVIVALGCSPGLGFVHSGTYRSFVYDIADLYKADLTIPIAFDLAASPTEESVGSAARKAVRDAVREFRLLERCVTDIKRLLSVVGDLPDDDELVVDDLRLWDDADGTVAAGVSYDEDVPW